MPAVPPPERRCKRPPGLLGAPLAAQRAWPGLAIVGSSPGKRAQHPRPWRNVPRHWRQWEAPATTGEARGGAREAGGSQRERRAPSCQRAGAAAGLLGKVPSGGRARAGDRVRGGAAGSLCDPGQRASPPWGLLLPPDAQTRLDGGPFRLRGLWVPTSTTCISSSSKLGAEKPVLGTRSLHAILLEEDAVVSVDSSTPTWTEACGLFLGPARHPWTLRLTNQDRGWVERVLPGMWAQACGPRHRG